jgi:hypothetical protein
MDKGYLWARDGMGGRYWVYGGAGMLGTGFKGA